LEEGNLAVKGSRARGMPLAFSLEGGVYLYYTTLFIFENLKVSGFMEEESS
jgi:hypothetical protein